VPPPPPPLAAGTGAPAVLVPAWGFCLELIKQDGGMRVSTPPVVLVARTSRTCASILAPCRDDDAGRRSLLLLLLRMAACIACFFTTF
jgi:hypothetical protein